MTIAPAIAAELLVVFAIFLGAVVIDQGPALWITLSGYIQ